MSIDQAVELGKLQAKFAAVEGVQQPAVDQLNTPAEIDAFKASGLDADAYLKKLRAERPHLFAALDPNAGVNADAAAVKLAMQKAAFGKKPTMEARGEYIAAYGLDDYNKNLIAWGGSASNLLRGYNPAKKNSNRETVKVGGETIKGEGNPWSKNYKGKDAEARRIAIIKSGTQRAVSLAKAAGTDLAGRPLRTA